jgi:hypothetical protein
MTRTPETQSLAFYVAIILNRLRNAQQLREQPADADEQRQDTRDAGKKDQDKSQGTTVALGMGVLL